MSAKYARYVLLINLISSICCLLLAVKYLLMPFAATLLYEERYKDLVFQCDHSMREHMIAKNKFLLEPGEETDRLLKSAETGLISCHDYDILRKRLLVFGIAEADLARFGLEAIERRAEDVRQIVRTHEFRY